MRILFLAHLFPLPLDSGGKIKSYYTLKALAARHEMRAIAFVRSDEEASLIPELTRVCAGVDVVRLERGRCKQVRDLLGSLALGRSFIIARDFRGEMLRAVRRAIEEFKPDIVHVDHLQMAQFVDFDGPYRVVLDNHNVESMIIKRVALTSKSRLTRLYAGIEWPKLQRFELETCGKCDLVFTVSEEDKAELQRQDPGLGNIEALPIGIDTEHFGVVDRNTSSKTILFLGTMYWPPNVDCVHYFCRDILPIVRRSIPDCTFKIAGQRPAKSVVALASDPAVTVTGYVDDVREVARDCGAFVVPLRAGSGVRVKILNAMSMGLPIVSTTVGAEGIEATPDEHMLIADSPEDFARAVVKVLTDRELAERLGRNARRLACEKYSWEIAGNRALELYDAHIAPKLRSPATACEQ